MSSTPHRMRMAAAIAVAGALALAGCGSSASDGGSGNKDNNASANLSLEEVFAQGLTPSPDGGTPKKGGELTLGEYTEARSMDPTVTYATGASGGNALAAIYDTLVRYDFEKNEWVGQLADSVTSSANDTVWTVKLRDGVKFTDGETLNAAAVVKSLKYYDSKYGYKSNLIKENAKSITTPDDSTVVFTLRSPWSGFPSLLSQGPGMIMAPKAYANADKFVPIGAGPFTFESYSPGESLILKANPDYWDGAPYLDTLKFVWIGTGDDAARITAIESNAVDVAFIRNPSVVTKARRAGLPGMVWAIGSTSTLAINARAGHPGADPLVRQAINYAIDAKTYGERIDNGESLAGKSLMGPNSPWYTEADAMFDTAKAKDLVDQAKAKGFTGNITFAHSAAPAAQAGAVLIKAMLEAAGMKVTLKPLRSVADQVQVLYIDHAFDLAVNASSFSDVDPYSNLTANFDAASATNVGGWSSPEMDKLLAKLRANDTPDTGKDVLAQIQDVYLEQSPSVTLSSGGNMEAWRDNVHGIVPNVEMNVLLAKAWKG